MHVCPRCGDAIKAGERVHISRSASGERIYAHREDTCPDQTTEVPADRIPVPNPQPPHQRPECLLPGECFFCDPPDGRSARPELFPLAAPAAKRGGVAPAGTDRLQAGEGERCPHEMPRGQCSYCKPPPNGLPQHVWITEGGQTFHSNASCPALRDGQDYAERLGMQIHPIVRGSVYEAISSRGQCTACFSAQDLANYAAWKRRKQRQT